MWYTLVRFKDAPQHITGVSQARTAGEAFGQMEAWEHNFPEDTVVVFDPKNIPVARRDLAHAAATAGVDGPVASK